MSSPRLIFGRSWSYIEELKLNQYMLLSSSYVRLIKNMRRPFSGSLVIDLGDFREDLFLIDGGEQDQGILDLGIIFLTNSTVINRSGIFKANEFYPNFFRYGDMSYAEWSTFIAFNDFRYYIAPQESYVLNGRRYRGNLLIHSVGANTHWEDSLVGESAAQAPGVRSYTVSLVKIAREASGFDGAPLVWCPANSRSQAARPAQVNPPFQGLNLTRHGRATILSSVRRCVFGRRPAGMAV